MKQKITINVNSTFKYLQLWNGIFNLTDMELRVLSILVDSQNVSEEDNLCSPKLKKVTANALGIKDPHTLNNYVKKFKDKRAIYKEGKNYKLNKLLNVNTESVEISINWTK
jgi:hypothetical protein|tara:strand:- start:1188 stop:1520 length:333 start_codon:yes stop_codon:yes gene_type:complete